MMTTAYEGGTARPAERPSHPRWAPSPGVQALRVRLARVPAAGALLRERRRDEYSVQQLTCPVCPIRKEGVHDGSLGRRACVQQVPPPPVDDRLGARLPRGGAEPSLRARPRSRPGSERGIWRAVLEKRPSTRFGQEPCLGANTNPRRSGTVARRRLAFAGVRADTSPGTIRVRSPPRRLLPGCSRGARRGRNPRASRPQGGRLAGRQVDRGSRRGATGRQSLPRPWSRLTVPTPPALPASPASGRRLGRCSRGLPLWASSPGVRSTPPPVYLAALGRTPSDVRPTLPATGAGVSSESRGGGIRALAAA